MGEKRIQTSLYCVCVCVCVFVMLGSPSYVSSASFDKSSGREAFSSPSTLNSSDMMREHSTGVLGLEPIKTEYASPGGGGTTAIRASSHVPPPLDSVSALSRSTSSPARPSLSKRNKAANVVDRFLGSILHRRSQVDDFEDPRSPSIPRSPLPHSDLESAKSKPLIRILDVSVGQIAHCCVTETP